MAGERGESWWQPPKDFEHPVADVDIDLDLDDVDALDDLDEIDGFDEIDDETEDPDVDLEPAAAAEEPEPQEPPAPEDHDELEVELEDDDRSPVPVGWTVPTGDLIPRDSGNRRFYAGIALIVVATAIGVLFALSLGDSDDGDSGEPAVTTIPLDVRGATTVRPGGLTPVCSDEKERVTKAEEDYRTGSVSGQYTDMDGLVSSGKLAAPSTLFVIANEVPGSPSVVSFAGTSAREYEDYLVLPIPDGPCDTT